MNINLKRFYKFYLKKIFLNVNILNFIKTLTLKHLNLIDNLTKRNLITFLLLRNNFFRSKLIFLLSKILWTKIILTNKFGKLDKIKIWFYANSIIKEWVVKNIFSEVKNIKLSIRKNKILKKNDLSLFITKFDNFLMTFSLLQKYNLQNKISSNKNFLISFNKLNKMLKRIKISPKLGLFNFKNKLLSKQSKNKRSFGLKLNKLAIRTNLIEQYKQTAFIIIKIKLNNLFITVVDYQGKTIYASSGGHASHKGQERINIYVITAWITKIANNLFNFNNIKRLIIIYKSNPIHKLTKSVLFGLKATRIQIAGVYYNYNRANTFLRRKKVRRI